MNKMMLNDVAENILYQQNTEPISINDIDKISTETADQQEIEIKMKINYHLLRDLKNNLQKKFGENHPSVNGYLCNKIKKLNEEFELQQHTSSLLFDGKEPRKDVLHKLLLIADEFELNRNFPNLKRRYIEFIIKTTLKNPDPRTLQKYVNCTTAYVEKSTGKRVYFNQDCYLGNFKKAVLEKIRELEEYSKEIPESD